MADRFSPRAYDLTQCIFTDESGAFAGLSNVVQCYPLHANGVRISTSEALYQACRYPHHPHIQQYIVDEIDGVMAKTRSRQYTALTRSDWNEVRVSIMRWCLRVKLAQHWDSFGQLLRATDDHSIVELSATDDFWGAVPREVGKCYGINVLGRLLIELREMLISADVATLYEVNPLAIPNFSLLGKPIGRIERIY